MASEIKHDAVSADRDSWTTLEGATEKISGMLGADVAEERQERPTRVEPIMTRDGQHSGTNTLEESAEDIAEIIADAREEKAEVVQQSSDAVAPDDLNSPPPPVDVARVDEHNASWREQLRRAVHQYAEAYKSVNWEELRETNPHQWIATRDKFQGWYNELVASEQDLLAQEHQTANAIAAREDYEHKKQIQAGLIARNEMILETYPELRDQALAQKAIDWAKDQENYTDQELVGLTYRDACRLYRRFKDAQESKPKLRARWKGQGDTEQTAWQKRTAARLRAENISDPRSQRATEIRLTEMGRGRAADFSNPFARFARFARGA